MDLYKKKYLKYKSKYLLMQSELEQEGGEFFNFTERTDIYPVVEQPVLRDRKEKETDEDYKYAIDVLPHIQTANREGQQLLDVWLSNRNSNGINEVLKNFETNGKPKIIKATAFSDYYKFTMMPVIWHLHEMFMTKNNNKNTLKVTFGIDIRDTDMRFAIDTDPLLREEIKKALDELAKRLFDKKIFEEMNTSASLLNDTLTTDCINYICDGRTLAKSVTMSETGRPKQIKEDDEVHIGFFKVANATYEEGVDDKPSEKPSEKPKGLWFIEARGPWPRVTWLETSLMQAVYEAYLRYNLKKLATQLKITEVKAYERWLYGALLRCAKSVAFTRIIQKSGKIITPALFTGRRTGGYLFILLQNLFFAHHFNQFTPAGDNVDSGGKTRCLGTSSVDSYFELTRLSKKTRNISIKCLNPVGTHAHELSMVISVLFPYFDKNKYDLPLTQIIGHELYRQLSAIPRPTPAGIVMFPMLPDTLGTAAFMKAANWVKVPKPGTPSEKVSFIELINSARQDSGKLPDFKKLMENWYYKDAKGVLKPMMASEIDDPEALYKAQQIGFGTWGAGGFYGDSGKAWNPNLTNASMAVKAVNVEYNVPEAEKQFYRELEFHHIDITKLDKGHIMGYPIKIGDPEDMANPALAKGKLSLDKTLPKSLIERIKKWASDRRERAFSSDNDSAIRAASLDINDIIRLYPKPITTNLATIRR